jgi:hypothetical protein
MMLALEYSHPIPITMGEIFLTAEMRTFRTTSFEATKFSPFVWETAEYTNKTGYTPDGQRGYITAFTRDPSANPLPNMIAADMRFDSVDMRKNLLDGVTAKLGYRYRTPSFPIVGPIDLQGGLTMAYLTSQEQARGAIHVLDWRAYQGQNTANAAWTANHPNLDQAQYGRLYSDYFFEVNSETKMAFGGFVGARVFIWDDLYFEMNVATLGHAELNYVPVSYTGKDPYVETSNKTKIVLEFNIGMRF